MADNMVYSVLQALTTGTDPMVRQQRVALLLQSMSDEDFTSFADTRFISDDADTDQTHRTQAETLAYFASILDGAFKRNGSLGNLSRAIALTEKAVDELSDNDSARNEYLYSLGNRLHCRFQLTDLSEDLDHAVEVLSTAAESTPASHQKRALYLNDLSTKLNDRSERFDSLDDLNRAIEASRAAVDASPPGHPYRGGYLTNLGLRLRSRAARTDSPDDLNQAIDFATQAVDITPEGHADRAFFLDGLAGSLGRRFETTGSVEDLDTATQAAISAVATTPASNPHRAMYLSNLANCYAWRFKQNKSLDSLDKAIEIECSVARSVHRNHPGRPMFLSNVARWRIDRFEAMDSIDDLDKAVEAIEDAISLLQHDHSMRAECMDRLGTILLARFQRNGFLEDLNRSVEAGNDVVDTVSLANPRRNLFLTNLGNRLFYRSIWTGSIDDLNRAVWAHDTAVQWLTQDHPERASCLNNLAISLHKRAARYGDEKDLNRAAEAIRTAINITSHDHRDRAEFLANYGIILDQLAQDNDSIDDLNRAVEVKMAAVNATPQPSLSQARRFHNLGASLWSRFKKVGDVDDLNKGIEAASAATKIPARDHPARARYLEFLGRGLESRFELTQSPSDQDLALAAYQEVWQCHEAAYKNRIRSAHRAAVILGSKKEWKQSYQALRDAVELLPKVSRRALEESDQLFLLSEIAGIGPLAAATALNAGEAPGEALRILELGRGVIAGLTMEIREEISDLSEKHPEMAAEFDKIRNELDSPFDMSRDPNALGNLRAVEMPSKRRRELEQVFNALIECIRAQPGFENFLMPLSTTELTKSARSGPVVYINLSSIRCDAFLVDNDRIRVLGLPTLNLEDVETRLQHLKSFREGVAADIFPILDWLWNVIGQPCLNELGFDGPVTDDNWPHVWWIPTGSLSYLPIHAAASQTQKSGEAVLDRVMSSYAPSIKSIIHGRRLSSLKSKKSLSSRAVLLGMRETPGLQINSTLPLALDEIDMLESLCPTMQLQPVRPSPRKNDVLNALQDCKIFHFAGHGKTGNVHPSLSSLLLEDWQQDPLIIKDLHERSVKRSSPFLAYLSACSTGTNEVDTLADEGIHLVNALQLAGFRHVVGTLWEVADRFCVDMARIVYETIRDEGMTDAAVCRGLHRAVRTLRDGKIEDTRDKRDAKFVRPSGQKPKAVNWHWVPYVHFGV